MAFQFVQSLFDYVGKYFKDKKCSEDTEYDVILHIGEEPNYKKFYAHSTILGINSKYFESALSSRWINKIDGYYILRIPNISPKVFEIILKFIYTDTISSNRIILSPLLFDILLAADGLCFDKLVDYIQDLLTDHSNSKTFLLNNLLKVYSLTNHFPHFQTLQKHIRMLIRKCPTQIFQSHYFFDLPEDIFSSCLENDNLNLYEVDIWNSVLDWGIKQIPRKLNKSKVKDWSMEDFMELEEKLKNCIPLIRFHHIKSKDFYSEIVPFQPIIPDSTFNDVLKYHLTNEILPVPFYSVRRPDLHESEALLEDKTSLLLKFLDIGKYLGYFWSKIYEKKLHGYIKFSLFLLLCMLYLGVVIFVIHMFMWLMIAFTMHVTIRKLIDYLNIETRYL